MNPTSLATCAKVNTKSLLYWDCAVFRSKATERERVVFKDDLCVCSLPKLRWLSKLYDPCGGGQFVLQPAENKRQQFLHTA